MPRHITLGMMVLALLLVGGAVYFMNLQRQVQRLAGLPPEVQAPALMDEPAFEAFREAVNYDPGASRDDTLWAKFHLATLYDGQGLGETARQMLCTLLRGRDAGDLHRRAEHRLGSRRCR